MANAVTFWKGSAAAFAGKTYVDGRIYFVTDDDNNGALYLGVTGENSVVEARLISPKRLTALTAEITDNLSTVTAKAVVDFVKAQIEAAFGADSAYAGKISEIEGRLDDVEDVLSGFESEGSVKAAVDAKVAQSDYDVDKAATAAILAGYGVGEGLVATVKEDIEAVKTIASAAMTFKGVKATEADLPTEGVENGDIYYVTADDTEYVYIAEESRWEALGGYVKAEVYTKEETNGLLAGKVDKTITVNGKALDANVTLTGADIAVDASDSSTVAAKLGELQDAINAITGDGEEGDATTIAGLAVEISAIKNYTVNGKKISENPVIAAADIEDVYSKTEVEGLISDATLVWVED